MTNPDLMVLGPDDRPHRARKGRPQRSAAHLDPRRPLSRGAALCVEVCADCTAALERLAADDPRRRVVIRSLRAATTVSAELASAATARGGWEVLLRDPLDLVDSVTVGRGGMPPHFDWRADEVSPEPRPPFVLWWEHNTGIGHEPDVELRVPRRRRAGWRLSTLREGE